MLNSEEQNKAENMVTDSLIKGKSIKIVITGGHHSSALPVIEEFRKRTTSSTTKYDIYWIGHRHSLLGDKNDTLEYKEITSLNIPFYELQAGKFYRTFNPLRLLKVPFGFFQALYLLIKIKPDVVLSFGGYLAVPVVLASWLLGIPSLTHEQTIVSGYANKFIANFVKTILISWPESKKYFDNKKVVVSGIPLRPEIYTSISNNFELNSSLPTVYITAGKTGSHKINELILSCLEELLGFCNVIHQIGDYSEFNDFEVLNQKYSSILNSKKDIKNSEQILGKYNSRKFVLSNEIGEAFSKSDLIIGRSGAHTVAEILALNKPMLFIPIPWVSHNEQFENASLAKQYGLAEVLEEKDLSKDSFISIIRNMLSNKSKYSSKIDTKTLFNKDSAKIIADEVISISNKI